MGGCHVHCRQDRRHAKFKSDPDLTRLASGKFDNNSLVCGLDALPMNILPLMVA